MTRVLLITDTARVQRVFESLEEQGAIKLQTVASLTQGDDELSSFAPDFVFIQSRISGFSSEIAIRHLKKSIPELSKMMLLAVDAEDAAQAKKNNTSSIDLSLPDDALGEVVQTVLKGGRPTTPKKGGKGRGKGAGKMAASPAEEPATSAPAPAPEQPSPVSPSTASGQAAPSAPVSAPAERHKETTVRPVSLVKGMNPEEVASASTKAAPMVRTLSVEELTGHGRSRLIKPAGDVPMQAPVVKQPARQQGGTSPAQGQASGLASSAASKAAAKSFAEHMGDLSSSGPAAASKPEEVTDRIDLGRSKSAATPTMRPEPRLSQQADEMAGLPLQGIPLADAMRRAQKEKRRPWVVPVIIAVILVPLLYLAVRKGESPRQSTPAVRAPHPAVSMAPLTAPAAPAPAAASKAAPRPTAGPAPTAGTVPRTVTPPAVTPAGKALAPPAAKQPPPTAPATKPETKAGVKSLPEFMSGTKLDPAYGKTHPGWTRYVGSKAEYKLFKEGNVYRAIQVIPLDGNIISEVLYRNVLKQFGGIEGYQLKSTGKKGDFVVEEGVARNGDVSLMIYREKKDLSMRGLVVYFR